MPNLTTIAKWAESLGISRQSGYDAVKRCEIPVTDGQVDAEYATLLYKRNTRQRVKGNSPDPLADLALPAAAGAGGAGGAEPPAARTPGYDTSRARREAAEARITEMREAEMAGKFLIKAEVDAAFFTLARALRDGMTNCQRRIAADVAALGTAEECEAVIEREHRALMESLVQEFSAFVGAPAQQGGA